MRRTAVLLAVCLLAGTAACGSSDGDDPASSMPAADVTVTPSTEEPAEEDKPGEKEDDGLFALTDVASYTDGVEVDLSKFSRGVSSEYAAPENTEYVKFTVKVTNGSDSTVDTSLLQVNCSYGEDGQISESIYDDGLEGAPSTKLLAGRSISVPWACELPKGEQVLQVEVAPDFESKTAIFTGSVK